MILDASLLNTRYYKVRIIGKWCNPGKVALSSTPWCSSYRKGSLRVDLDYSRSTFLLVCPDNDLKNIVGTIAEVLELYMTSRLTACLVQKKPKWSIASHVTISVAE